MKIYRFFATVATLLSLMVHHQAANAQQCADLNLTNPIVAGTLTLGTGTVAGNAFTGSGNVLSASGARTSSAVIIPDSTPKAFPTFTSATIGAGTSIAPGYYDKVTSNPSGFAGGDTYTLITTLTTPNSGVTTFAKGTYFIKTWTIGKSATINVTGDARIYIGSSVSMGKSVKVNSTGNSNSMLITLLGSASLTSSNSTSTPSVIKATIVSDSASASVDLGNATTFTGNILSEGNVRIRNSAVLNNGASSSNTHTCPNLADYQFDEQTWIGAAGEIIDSGPKGYHASSKLANTSANRATPFGSTTKINPARTPNTAGTCNFGVFDRTTPDFINNATYTYVELPASFPKMNSSFTFMAWVNTSNASQSGQRVFTTDDADDGWGFSIGDSSPGTIRLFNRKITSTGTVTGSGGSYFGCGVFCLDTNAVFASNTWYFVALRVDTVAKSVTINVFNQAGASLANPTGYFNGTWGPGTGKVAIGGETAGEGTGPNFHFKGAIDEARIFQGVLSDASVNAQKDRVRSCPISLSGFVFSGTGAASTCAPQTITVTAKDSLGSTVTNYTNAVTLSTSSGKGNWTLATGSGAFVAGAADSGLATYTYAASDAGFASFALSNERAGSLTVNANDAASAITSTSAAVNFTDNAFVVAPSDPLGLQVVAGRPHAFSASLFKKDPTTGNCSLATGYTGSKSLDFWTTNSGSHPAASTAPSIDAASACASPAALASSAPAVNAASNTISLNFTAGAAPFHLCASDVGQYAINVRDDTLSFAGTVITGASSTATARPFALAIDAIQSGATANPGGTASAGTKFIPAQTAFSARVTAKNWASGQDTLIAGTPDPTANLSANATTAGFAAASSIAASAQTPSLGILGTLSGGSVASASFASGVAAATPLSYSEAGSIKLTATSSNYLGSGFNVPGVATGNVGRFHAASFAPSGASASPSCASGAFTYMAQNFPLAATLQAVGSSGGFLLNYDQAKGYAFLATPAWRAVDALDGVDRGARLSTGTAPTWTAGAWSFNSTAVQFNRLANPDGQYDQLQIGLSAVDADGAAIAGMNMSYTAPGTCVAAACNAKAVGSTQKIRFGRLDLSNAYGSILTTLRTEAKAQYWTKSATGTPWGWSQNTLDSCTTLPYASMGLGGYLGSVGSATLPSGSLTLSSGKGTIVVTRPAGATVSGSVNLGINLGAAAASPNSCLTGLPSVAASATPLAHLQSNHCNASNFNLNPNARLTWGNASGKSGATVFIRETY